MIDNDFGEDMLYSPLPCKNTVGTDLEQL